MERYKNAYVRLVATFLFVVLTLVGLAFSVYLFISVHSIYMYIVAVLFAFLTAISGFFNITTSYLYYRSYLYAEHLDNIKKTLKPLSEFPSVAVAMPVYNENPSMVMANLTKLKELNYSKQKLSFYLLDDSTDKKISSCLSSFCKKNGVNYIRRKSRKGFKAGALNHLLEICKEEFLAIFDYDERLTNPRFLKDVLPYFQDPLVSYVQTEKQYANGTFFSDSIKLFDAFFFRFIQPARALNNTAIFAGSCGVIRVSHLRKIGGFPEYVIEDTFFSFESDSNGFKSLYIPRTYALGKPITTFTELVHQQWRYNYGDNQFLCYLLDRKKRCNKKKLSALAEIDYITHGFGLNYISVILLFFTLVSIFIVFSQFGFGAVPLAVLLSGKDINMDLEILGISSFSVSVLTPIIMTKIYFKSISKGVMIFLLNFALAVIRATAAVSALLALDYKSVWGSGERGSKSDFAYSARNSVLETVFSATLLLLGILALVIDNISGGLWLFWYAAMYASAFYMFYRYG